MAPRSSSREYCNDRYRSGNDDGQRAHLCLPRRRRSSPAALRLGRGRLGGGEGGELVGESARGRLREAADRLTRYVEDLEALRDRAAVAQEELAARLSDQMNRTMYVLSLVATLFLPIGFVTGLFGVNVAGMPGTETESAFLWLILVLVLITGVQAVFFRLRRWL